MKYIPALLFVLLSFGFVHAQSEFSFITTDVKEARRIADSIALTGPRNFKYEKTFKASENASSVAFIYSSKELRKGYNDKIIKMYEAIGLMRNFKADNVRMSIVFKIYTKEDGTRSYRFSGTKGSFQDLFPFWFKYIQPKADAKEIVENRRAVSDVGNKKFIFNEMGNEWDMYLDSGI